MTARFFLESTKYAPSVDRAYRIVPISNFFLFPQLFEVRNNRTFGKRMHRRRHVGVDLSHNGARVAVSSIPRREDVSLASCAMIEVLLNLVFRVCHDWTVGWKESCHGQRLHLS